MYVIFLSPKFPPFFFLCKAMLCSSFFQDRKKKSVITDKGPALKNNSEIATQSVCVIEEESACGDRRGYRFRLPQGSYGDRCRQHYWKRWGTSSTKNYEDPGTCLQLTCLHSLCVARYDVSLIFRHRVDLLDSYYSMGGRISQLREEAVTAGAWGGVLPVWMARSFRFIANSKK